jgi:hypothetical protein
VGGWLAAELLNYEETTNADIESDKIAYDNVVYRKLFVDINSENKR